MMASALPPDATLHNLQSSPADKEAFARKALGVMHVASKTHGQVVLRMGVTGTGQQPNYRLEDANGRVHFAVDGNNHQPWPDGANINTASTWSTVAMSYADIQEVIASSRRRT